MINNNSDNIQYKIRIDKQYKNHVGGSWLILRISVRLPYTIGDKTDSSDGIFPRCQQLTMCLAAAVMADH